MQKRLGRWSCLVGGLLLCGLLAVVVFLYSGYATDKAMPTIPQVSITGTYPKGAAIADQSVVVFGQANDPDGIAEVQLWVNGQMVASQTNINPRSDQPFEVSQAWIPTGAANYLVLLRAIDGKGSAGQSDPIMVEATERLYTYEVKPGETIQEIAEQFGTTPEDIQERNPSVGEAPAPGTSLDVPAAPAADGGDSGGVPSAGGEAEEPPRVDPPAPPPPPSSDETPAETASLPFWRRFPLPDSLICLIYPSVCATPLADEPLSPPVNISATLNDSTCQVLIVWQDATEGEDGFRVYRVASRPFRTDLVAMLQASPGTGERLSYLDANPPNGEYSYLIAAYNERGEFWSAPSETITISCHSLGGGAVATSLVVEGLEMTVNGAYDRLYCYVSLAGSPFERVPYPNNQFIELEGGSWNIAEHFGGENKRVILHPEGTPLNIVAECLGWQGDALINLGQFTRSHPREEWDGRRLTAGPPDGSFSVTYRIQPFIETEGEVGSSTWALTDPTVPTPYNLRTALDYRLTPPSGDPEEGVSAWADAPGLAWDYAVDPGNPRPPVDFRVYYRTEGESTPIFYHQTYSGDNRTAPQKGDHCNETVFYSVSAVVGTDPSSGEIIESPLSAELEVPPSCITLEVTLISFTLNRDVHDGEYLYSNWGHNEGCFDDCGATVEAFGAITFNDVLVRWNNHFHGSSFATEYTSVQPGVPIQFADERLDSGNGFGLNQNVIRMPITDGQALNLSFDFDDHDSGSSDDHFCGSWSLPEQSATITVARGRSDEEWLAMEQDFTITDYVQDGVPQPQKCEITFHVRGVR